MTHADDEPNWVDYGFGSDGFGDNWMPAVIPTPEGPSERIDPHSRTTLDDGVVQVEIPKFSASSDIYQGIDNTKFLMFTKNNLVLASDRAAHFSVDMAAHNVSGNPDDYRGGAAALVLTDLESGTYMVFDLYSTSTRVNAIYERLTVPGVDAPFTRAIENPFLGAGDNFEGFHNYRIVLDKAARTARYYVDGSLLHEERAIDPFPDSVHLGLAIFTLRPIVDGKSTSNVGQGLVGRWKNVRYAL